MVGWQPTEKAEEEGEKAEQAPPNVTPLKLTCEIELGPMTLASIAEHVESLFLKKMMAQLPND
jgi:hypothetical protein